MGGGSERRAIETATPWQDSWQARRQMGLRLSTISFSHFHLRSKNKQNIIADFKFLWMKWKPSNIGSLFNLASVKAQLPSLTRANFAS